MTDTGRVMTDAAPRLYLTTPLVDDAEAFAPLLAAACASGDIAAICLRLAPADERTQINRIKRLAPLAQEKGTAVLVACDDAGDWPLIAARGGADGVHTPRGEPSVLADLRAQLTEGRILGAGHLRARHDAMEAGEAGVDYVLFGEPGEDGKLPPLSAVIERAQWWSEIFETPCVAHAPDLAAIGPLVATGADFIGLSDAVWTAADGPAAAIAAATAQLMSGVRVVEPAALRPLPA